MHAQENRIIIKRGAQLAGFQLALEKSSLPKKFALLFDRCPPLVADDGKLENCSLRVKANGDSIAFAGTRTYVHVKRYSGLVYGVHFIAHIFRTVT